MTDPLAALRAESARIDAAGMPASPRPARPEPDPPPAYLALTAAVAEVPIFADLVALHRPCAEFVRSDGTASSWECDGDDFGGWEADRPEWPCRTVEIIARHVGVNLGRRVVDSVVTVDPSGFRRVVDGVATVAPAALPCSARTADGDQAPEVPSSRA
jgi:hypothetical protein